MSQPMDYLFEVKIEGRSGYTCEVSARDMEQAAEKALEQWDESDGEYPVAGGEIRFATVTDVDGRSKRFKMTGEFIATYTAEEMS